LAFLRTISLLQKFSYTSIKKAVPLFQNEKKVIRNSYLFKEGQPADKIYIVKSGEFKVTKKITQEVTNEDILMGEDGVFHKPTQK
jgi:CRP-like cAMP-binding protein